MPYIIARPRCKGSEHDTARTAPTSRDPIERLLFRGKFQMLNADTAEHHKLSIESRSCASVPKATPQATKPAHAQLQIVLPLNGP
jgi:hypothetical protein